MLQREQLFQELVHDSYKSGQKLHEPARCPECGACFHKGRWTWEPAPASAPAHICPACRRTSDDFPAGYVTLSGPFLQQHADEIRGLIEHCEAAQKAEHPMQRIMAIKPSEAGMLITTTDVHLARNIAERLHHAYKGKLEFHYNKEQNLLRALWSR